MVQPKVPGLVAYRRFPAVLAAALLLASCGGGGEGKGGGPGGPGGKRPPQLVSAQAAGTEDFAPTLIALGTVTPRQSVAVRPRADGEIIGIGFREGDFVRAGQVLFRLDPRTALANVRQAEAELKGAVAAERRATLDYERAEALVGKGFVSAAARDLARANAYSARSAIETARAQLEAAKVQLSFLTITAPISGRTGELGFRIGANVRAGEATALVTINQLSPIHVRFLVPAADIQAARRVLANGGRVEVREQGVPGGSAPLASGKLVFLDNNVDPGNGAVVARAEFDNGGDILWPGAILNVALPLGAPSPMIALPESAVQTGRDAPFVWTVASGGKVVMRNVQVAGRYAGKVYLAGGVQPGEQVIVDTLAKLKEGDAVKVKPIAGTAPVTAGQTPAAVGNAG
jgi:multidrug efflux system membrane fusion protein